jgi:hypothetical protein
VFILLVCMRIRGVQNLGFHKIGPSVPSRILLADARGSETLILSRDREGAVVKN